MQKHNPNKNNSSNQINTKMKNYYLFIALILPLFISAQIQKTDPIAIQILDQMHDVIGDLESCSFNLSSSQDIIDPDHGWIKTFNEDEVIMKGPDKMLVIIDGNKGRKGFWYNGKHVIYYSYNENNFAILDAKDNVLTTIDGLHNNYGIDVPAADFFYPSGTDDILEEFDTLKYLGKKMIGNKECFHIKASNKLMDVQYWISNDAYNLPKKYLIVYKNKNNKQYEATFNNWVLNPIIPNSIFEFAPPAKAVKINLLAK